MSTMYDYVNSQTTGLTADNYTELDALVFSKLSYFKFEEYGYTMGDVEVSVQEYAQNLIDNPSPSWSTDDVNLLNALASSDRYRNCTITDFAVPSTLEVNGENLESQWAAFTVNINDNTDTSVVAMRGTDATTLGWREDFELAYDVDGTNAQILSEEYLKHTEASNIYAAGHSKGGNDVISGYIMSDESVRDRITRIDNFEGPGVISEFGNNFPEGYSELDGKLNSYYPQDSIIGRLLVDKPGNITFIKSEVRDGYKNLWVFGEHDPYSFVIGDNNTFVPEEPSALSKILNTTLDEAITTLDLAEREKLIYTMNKLGVFSMIAGDGTDPYSDNKGNLSELLDEIDKLGILSDKTKENIAEDLLIVTNIYEGVKIFIDSSEEEKAATLKALALIAYYGAGNSLDELNEWVEEKKDQINAVYTYAAEQISNFRDSIVDKVEKVKNGIITEIDDIREKISKLADKIFDNERTKTGAHSSSANFAVDLNVLNQNITDLNNIAKKLYMFSEEVSQVKKCLSQFSFGFNSFMLTILENKLNSEKRDCEKMSKGLEKVVSLYNETERNIVSNLNI